MVELTIDGKTVSVPEGSMVMHAAHELGVYVPHFCYHKKLSVAASCRMCLVEVEKARKPVPACATPVTQGMVVHTHTPAAVAAQKAVMEFLLVNHPLDCPICDQGGECQLQDLAVGYGQSSSRYQEEKRVIFHKNLGPLISAEEMSRCIQCTRCVRFGQEVAGIMELGMLGRGEHSEISTFVGNTVQSEISGNMIDICPVGALTSKPFRYTARTWELARRRSVSPHDSTGANLIVQVKRDRVMRVVPYENEAVNECWISNKDRWSYEGLYAEDRVQSPMIKENGQWREASWEEALNLVCQTLTQIKDSEGSEQIGALANEMGTLEEYALLARLVRGLGSEHIESRLRLNDATWDEHRQGTPWLGMPIEQLNKLDVAVVIGSDLREDHPLFAQRLRQATKRGCQVILIDSVGTDPYFPVAERITVAPSQLHDALEEVVKGLQGQSVSSSIQAIVDRLKASQQGAVLLGNAVVNAPDASHLVAQAQIISQGMPNASFGFLTNGGNTVGAYIAGAVPQDQGMDYTQLLDHPLKAYVVLHAEALDMDHADKATALLSNAFTVALTSYMSNAKEWASVILPVAPFTETSGTFINAEGRVQSFNGVVAGLGQSRPAWKVLRVMGTLLQLEGFTAESSDAIRDEVLHKPVTSYLNNQFAMPQACEHKAVQGFERVATLPNYRGDAMVRRATALQKACEKPSAGLNANSLKALGVQVGDYVTVTSPSGTVQLPVQLVAGLADQTVRVPQGFEQTQVLGSAFTQLTVERV